MADNNGKKLRGRPEFVPNDKQREDVESLSGMLVPHAEVARFIGIDDKTLRKHFRAELDHGRQAVNRRLKAIVFTAARKGSIRAATYLLDRLPGAWPEADVGNRPPGELKITVVGGVAGLNGSTPGRTVALEDWGSHRPRPNGHEP